MPEPLEFVARTKIAAPPAALFDFHRAPDAFERLVPPWEKVEVVANGPLVVGTEVVLRVRFGPFALPWVARLVEVRGEDEPELGFRDLQVRGPFRRWEHQHRFLPDPENPDGSILEDRVLYELPLGVLGRIFGGGITRRKLTRMFEFRHRATADALAPMKGVASE